jgi:tetratricopeptide (TPR) repeat protein
LAVYTNVEHRKAALGRQALEMARRLGDKTTLADVLTSTQWATHGPDALHESMAATEELGRLADEIGDSRLRALVHRRLLDQLLERGDIDGIDRELEALQRLAETRKEPYVIWLLTVFLANRAHLGGRLEDCESLARDALALGFEGHDESAAQIFGAQMLFVRREQGRLVELAAAVEALAEQYPEVVSWRCGLAWFHAQLEHTAQARQQLDALAHDSFADLPRDVFWLTNVAWLCETVVLLGDAPRAQLLYNLLLPYQNRYVVTLALLCQGSASRPLGRLATTLKRYDDAERHFKQAIKMNVQIRSPLWVAHTQHDYARLLLLRNHPDDNERAVKLLREALTTADELGLTALADTARPLKLTAAAAGSSPALARPA